MAGQNHGQAPSGECAVASPAGGLRTHPLARLEPPEAAAGLRLLRDQLVEVQVGAGRVHQPPAEAPPLQSRTERAHWWLSWAERLARNARARAVDPVTIRLFGVPATFATSLGLATE